MNELPMTRTAYINLTTREIRISPTNPELLRKFLGGRGYASKLLFDSVGPEINPLGPENLLIFSIGHFGGTPWPTSSRCHLTFKSPLTGGYGHSNSGGTIGAEIARNGYDAIVISGKSPSPVYLFVTGSGIEIRPADALWGLEVSDTSRRLEPLGKVACIGPAGERLVRISGVMVDRNRAAARAGGGAVMGSKLLKAVVVQVGEPKTLSPEFKAQSLAVMKRLSAAPQLDSLRRYGTSILVDIQNMSGAMPSRNHQRVQVPFIQEVNAASLDRYVEKGKGCYACPVRCGRVTRVEYQDRAGQTGGPEYETLSALGPMTWLSDMKAIVYANLRCNELGLDSISTGVTIAFALECHQRGLLDDDTLSLEWGDPNSILQLIERIGLRQGIGDLLAEGSLRAARAIGGGAEAYAMQVKGMELPRQDPRVSKSFGLGHATSNRGADHLYGLPTTDVAGLWETAKKYFPAEILEDLMDSQNETYKADIVVLGEHFCAVVDSLGICKLITSENHASPPEEVAQAVSNYLGLEMSGRDLLLIGERIVNLERAYNTRQGMNRKDDYLPARFMTEPVDVWEYRIDPETGEAVQSTRPVISGSVLHDFDSMLDRYYQLRGWTRDGVPTLEKLKQLDLLD